MRWNSKPHHDEIIASISRHAVDHDQFVPMAVVAAGAGKSPSQTIRLVESLMARGLIRRRAKSHTRGLKMTSYALTPLGEVAAEIGGPFSLVRPRADTAWRVISRMVVKRA